MKKLDQQSGVTLTELLIATVLIGIVMTGVASFTLAIKHIQDSTNKATILATRAAAGMSSITRNGQLATGDGIGGGANYGYVFDASATPPYFSFRLDLNNPQTPVDYTDDTWVIYTDAGIDYSLYVCTQTAAEGPIPNTSSTCDPDNNVQLIGNIAPGGISFNLIVNSDINFLDYYFALSITVRDDPTSAAHPVNNPEYTLTSNITSLSHSW